MQLKAQLPFVTGTNKVDCLNKIATRYVYSGVVRSDSAQLYAGQAVEEAERADYKMGLCVAANLYANSLLQQSKPKEGINWYRLSTRLAIELNNDSLTAWGYRGTGQALWYQGDFERGHTDH